MRKAKRADGICRRLSPRGRARAARRLRTKARNRSPRKSRCCGRCCKIRVIFIASAAASRPRRRTSWRGFCARFRSARAAFASNPICCARCKRARFPTRSAAILSGCCSRPTKAISRFARWRRIWAGAIRFCSRVFSCASGFCRRRATTGGGCFCSIGRRRRTRTARGLSPPIAPTGRRARKTRFRSTTKTRLKSTTRSASRRQRRDFSRLESISRPRLCFCAPLRRSIWRRGGRRRRRIFPTRSL